MEDVCAYVIQNCKGNSLVTYPAILHKPNVSLAERDYFAEHETYRIMPNYTPSVLQEPPKCTITEASGGIVSLAKLRVCQLW